MEQTKLESKRNIHGRWLMELRNGSASSLVPHNRYLYEAIKQRDMVYTLPELEEGYNTLFDDMTRPLLVEVGCYFGDTLVELAQHNPGFNCLGLDIKYKRVVKTVRKIKRAKIAHTKTALCDVLQFMELPPKESVTAICVFFPDPWRKTRHEKYRYLNSYFFKMAHEILVPNGFIWFKTDHPDYYRETIDMAVQGNFRAGDKLPGDMIQERPYKTLFEDVFINQNRTIHEAFFLKK
jgi:tRNA (guanine-N7-)-methyltransferase